MLSWLVYWYRAIIPTICWVPDQSHPIAPDVFTVFYNNVVIATVIFTLSLLLQNKAIGSLFSLSLSLSPFAFLCLFPLCFSFFLSLCFSCLLLPFVYVISLSLFSLCLSFAVSLISHFCPCLFALSLSLSLSPSLSLSLSLSLLLAPSLSLS